MHRDTGDEEERDIRTRIEEALKDRRGDIELLDILENADQADVPAIAVFLPALVPHREWTIRAEALEFVGRYHLQQFLDLVEARLSDKNGVVRQYALTAYYDLLGKEALPLLEAASGSRDVGFRVTALALRYIEGRDECILESLRRILLRKRCYYGHRYAALNTFDAFVDVGGYPEIIELFELIRGRLDVSRAYGLDKDLPEYLRRWRRSQRERLGK